MITRNNPQIMREWTANEIEPNKYTAEDIYYFLTDIARVAPSEQEARKILILAIRAAKNEGGYSSAYVKKKVELWLSNGLATAEQVGEFEKNRSLRGQKGKFGQPLKFESGPSKPTAEQIDQQNQRMAKELGYASVEDMAKGTADKLSELRQTRPERLDGKSANGRTANGRRVLQRF
ncbi:hypothetical protein D0504_02765 [Weissella confusa]|uniref:hypothetical protein n=1 Tax=Weissella confusa TaxID=1583 RepID=UPI0021C05B6E|nr:hypothetical protein [Weissella confusa]MCT8392662.1 hypothetical protein [Weissella confusa]